MDVALTYRVLVTASNFVIRLTPFHGCQRCCRSSTALSNRVRQFI